MQKWGVLVVPRIRPTVPQKTPKTSNCSTVGRVSSGKCARTLSLVPATLRTFPLDRVMLKRLGQFAKSLFLPLLEMLEEFWIKFFGFEYLCQPLFGGFAQR